MTGEMTGLPARRLGAVFVAGGLLLNFPLLLLWDVPLQVAGLPLLPLALFLLWGTLIGLLAWLLEGEDGPASPETRSTDGIDPP